MNAEVDALQVMIAVLNAAISHAKSHAPRLIERRRVAVFYLEVEYQEAIQRREYWRATCIGRVLRLTRHAALLTSLMERLHADVLVLQGEASVPVLTGDTNTGKE